MKILFGSIWCVFNIEVKNIAQKCNVVSSAELPLKIFLNLCFFYEFVFLKLIFNPKKYLFLIVLSLFSDPDFAPDSIQLKKNGS
jgi:hypothetical protein